MKLTISIVIETPFGVYEGEHMIVDENQYSVLLGFVKEFYKSEVGFETKLVDGTFLVVPPKVLKQSVMMLKKI